MKKYKICPVCAAHNHPQFLECVECETDLQSIPVVDEETAQMEARNAAEAPVPAAAGTMVRICDCGARNPVQSRRCRVCAEDISMIVPTPDAASAAEQFLLSALDGAYAYEVGEGTAVIGRENEMQDYLTPKVYVSRKHAEISLDPGSRKLAIRNCSTTNHTFVNNNMIPSDVFTELKDGDEIGLGGNEQNGARQNDAAYFVVRIGTCM